VEAVLESFNCSTCKTEITVTPSNSIFIRYPEGFYSHLMVKCECECQHRLFAKVDEQEDIIEYVGMAVLEIEDVPDFIMEAWLQTYLDEPEYIDECFGVNQTQELPTTDEILDEVVVQDFSKWLEEVSPDEFG
jgi:hypothetical protein